MPSLKPPPTWQPSTTLCSSMAKEMSIPCAWSLAGADHRAVADRHLALARLDAVERRAHYGDVVQKDTFRVVNGDPDPRRRQPRRPGR